MRIISSDSSLDERDSSALSLPLFSNRIRGEKLRSLHVIQTCAIPIVAPSANYVYNPDHCLWMTCSTVPQPHPGYPRGVPLPYYGLLASLAGASWCSKGRHEVGGNLVE